MRSPDRTNINMFMYDVSCKKQRLLDFVPTHFSCMTLCLRGLFAVSLLADWSTPVVTNPIILKSSEIINPVIT